MKKNLYIQFENNFFDKIINKKRIEMVNHIKKKINIRHIKDLLDIGTTEDSSADSSNIFCKMLNNIKIHKSISNQKIKNKRFKLCKKNLLLQNSLKKLSKTSKVI